MAIIEILSRCFLLLQIDGINQLYNGVIFIYFIGLYFIYAPIYKATLLFRILQIITILFITMKIIEVGINGFSKFSNATVILISVYYIILALMWFYYILNSDIQTPILQLPEFYYSTALLLFSTGFIFRAMARDYIAKLDRDFLTIINNLFTSLNIIFVLLFIFGVRCNLYQQKSKLLT